jgi:hypothetical protein
MWIVLPRIDPLDPPKVDASGAIPGGEAAVRMDQREPPKFAARSSILRDGTRIGLAEGMTTMLQWFYGDERFRQ